MCKVIDFNPLPVIDCFISVDHRHGDQDPEWNWKRRSDHIKLFICCSSFDEIEPIRKAAFRDIEKNYRSGSSSHELSST